MPRAIRDGNLAVGGRTIAARRRRRGVRPRRRRRRRGRVPGAAPAPGLHRAAAARSPAARAGATSCTLDAVPLPRARPHAAALLGVRPVAGADRRRHGRRRLRRQARLRPGAVRRAARAQGRPPGQARQHAQRGVPSPARCARTRSCGCARPSPATGEIVGAGGECADGRGRLRRRDAVARRRRDAHGRRRTTASARSASAAAPSTRTRRRPAPSAASAGTYIDLRARAAHGQHRRCARHRPARAAAAQRLRRRRHDARTGRCSTTASFAKASSASSGSPRGARNGVGWAAAARQGHRRGDAG